MDVFTRRYQDLPHPLGARPRLLSVTFPHSAEFPFLTPDVPHWLKWFKSSPDGKLWMPMSTIQSPYFATGNPETEEMTTLYAPGMLGCIAEFDQGTPGVAPNKCIYQLIKQAASITGAVGNVFCWSAKATYTATTAMTNQGQIAGICRIVSATAASYIWLCKRGDREVLIINSPTSAPDATGKPIVSSSTTGSADCLALATAASPSFYIGASLSTQDGTTKRANTRISLMDEW